MRLSDSNLTQQLIPPKSLRTCVRVNDTSYAAFVPVTIDHMISALWNMQLCSKLCIQIAITVIVMNAIIMSRSSVTTDCFRQTRQLTLRLHLSLHRIHVAL